MYERITLNKFRDSGLLWFINKQLHLFGIALVIEEDPFGGLELYPARTKFRGFSQESNDKGYKKLTKYMKENADELMKECEEE